MILPYKLLHARRYQVPITRFIEKPLVMSLNWWNLRRVTPACSESEAMVPFLLVKNHNSAWVNLMKQIYQQFTGRTQNSSTYNDLWSLERVTLRSTYNDLWSKSERAWAWQLETGGYESSIMVILLYS